MSKLSYEDNVAHFWSHIDTAGPCWIWTGTMMRDGHGSTRIQGKHMGAHRAAWIIINGPILPGLIVCHQCQNPACVNPKHLRLGTRSDNAGDKNKRSSTVMQALEWTPKPRRTLEERFWAKVQKTDSCWIWTGRHWNFGYGCIVHEGKTLTAHRLAWEFTHGTIPEGLLVRHFVCDNPPCVNPDHLALGTHKDNSQDAVSKGRQSRLSGPAHHNYEQRKTHCKQGHPLTEDNAVWIKRNNGSGKTQLCKICKLANEQRKEQRRLERQAIEKLTRVKKKRIFHLKTHCRKGHELTPENLHLESHQDPTRQIRRCRICREASYLVKAIKEKSQQHAS